MKPTREEVLKGWEHSFKRYGISVAIRPLEDMARKIHGRMSRGESFKAALEAVMREVFRNDRSSGDYRFAVRTALGKVFSDRRPRQMKLF